jgi:hypothetical protein
VKCYLPDLQRRPLKRTLFAAAVQDWRVGCPTVVQILVVVIKSTHNNVFCRFWILHTRHPVARCLFAVNTECNSCLQLFLQFHPFTLWLHHPSR